MDEGEMERGRKFHGQTSVIKESTPAGGRVWRRGKKNCCGARMGTGFERIYPDCASASNWILRCLHGGTVKNLG
jgi:hypothetical protein